MDVHPVENEHRPESGDKRSEKHVAPGEQHHRVVVSVNFRDRDKRHGDVENGSHDHERGNRERSDGEIQNPLNAVHVSIIRHKRRFWLVLTC